MSNKIKLTLIEKKTGYEILTADGAYLGMFHVLDWENKWDSETVIEELRSCLSQALGIPQNVFLLVVANRKGGAK